MTKFSSTGARTLNYESKDNHILAAVASGKKGEMYYLLIEAGNSGGSSSRSAMIYRAKSDESSIIRSAEINTASGTGLDIYELDTSASMAYLEAEETVTIYVSRFKTPDNRGNIDQGSIAAVYGSSTLQLIKILNDG